MRIQSYVNPVFSQHEEPPGHPERRQRFVAALQGIQQSRVSTGVVEVGTRPASEAEILSVHSEQHLTRLAMLAGRSGSLDADTYYSPHSYEAALHAAGAACLMVEQLLNGGVDYGFVPARPPGHHAEADAAMGFCLLNNAAIAAAKGRALGAERVLVLDWDVHHGNGTESIFYGEPNVMYVSLHENPQYPGTGASTDVGDGAGKGTTVNVPLRSGATNTVYLRAFDRIVLPVVEAFSPELVLVSAGFDGHARDPLGGMQLTDVGFGLMMRGLLERLPKRGRGRVGILLEGGYDLQAISSSVAATLSACDPSADFPQQQMAPLAPHWEAEIDHARRVHQRHWSLE